MSINNTEKNLVRTESTKAVKPRTAWCFLVLKGKTLYEIHIMWKDARNCLETYKVKGKDKLKKEFGLIVKAEIVIRKNSHEELGDYFKVTNEYGDIVLFKASLMNPGIMGSNTFSKTLVNMRTGGQDIKLAAYITKLCQCKEFSQNNPDVHNNYGQLKGTEFENDEEFEKFYAEAKEFATQVTSTTSNAVDTIAEKTKRRTKMNVKKKAAPKLKKQERIEKFFRKEIIDSEGVEQEVVKKGLGRSDIPIDCLTVCEKVQLPIYKEKVTELSKDMVDNFEPTQLYLTVVPADQEHFDHENLQKNQYLVVHGRHRLLALKLLDQDNKLTNLSTLENRTVTCFIIGVSDDVALNYLWHRGNKLAAKFVFSPTHHDLLFTLQGMKLLIADSNQVLKAVERFATLQKKSDAEKLALRNLSKWPNEALDLLKKVLIKYQNYQTLDTDDKVMKKSFARLQKGEKLITPMSLFKEVSKLLPAHFLENAQDILEGKVSLKDLVKNHSKILERKRKEAKIMENSGYQTFQNLKNQFPDQFSDDIIDKLPINDKPSSSSQPSLESYTKSVCSRSVINSSQGQLLLIEVHKDLAELTSLLARAKRSSVQEMLKNEIKTLKNKLESNLTDPYHFTGKEEEKIAQIDGCEESASEESEEELEYENCSRRRKRSSSYDCDSESPIKRRPTTVFDREKNQLKLISPSKRFHEICNHSILLRAKRSMKDKEEEDDEEGSLENDAIDLQALDSEGLVLMGLPTWLVNPEDLVEELEEVANGGHKGDSILGDGDKLDKLMFDNKIVRLLGVLKESTPIGDKGTVEKKIRDRHVEKYSNSAKVVEDQQIERYIANQAFSDKYVFNDESMPSVPEDTLLSKLDNKQKVLVWSSFMDENLTVEERKAVWDEYNNKKTACCEEFMQVWKEMVNTIKNTQQIPETMLPKLGDERIMVRPINTMSITDKLKQMNPKLSQDELVARTWAAMTELQTMQWAQPKVFDNLSTFNDDQKNKAECEYDQSPGMYLRSHSGNMNVGHHNMRTRGPGAAPDPSHGEVLTLDRGTDTDLPHMASMLVRATSITLRVDLAQEGTPS